MSHNPFAVPPTMSIPVDGLSELVLEVADLEAAERFYTGALGLPVVERYASGEAIWVMAGDHTRIGLWLPQLGVAGGRGGAHVHFAFRIDERDFDGAVARLRSWGLEPQIESRRRYRSTANRSAYVFDPDGNCVELWTQDLPKYVQRVTGQASAAPAASDAFSRSPAGQRDSWWNQPTVRAHLARTRLEATFQLVGEGPGSVLHVNTGSGRLLPVLAERDWIVTGIDPHPHLVEVARARLPEDAGQLSVGSAEALPFPDHSFDVVVVTEAFEKDDLQGPLDELVRVLRPGGRVVLALRNNRAPAVVWRFAIVYPLARGVKRVLPFGRKPPKRERWPLSPERLRRLLGTAGFVVQHVEPVGCELVLDPIDRIAPKVSYRAARRGERSPRLRRVFGTERLVLAVGPEAGSLGPSVLREPVAVQDHPAQG
jgi:SAM-dependent methyltransferase/catechol 2,3-dioxygenase-like lactoylglutathione lyase family enzyme